MEKNGESSQTIGTNGGGRPWLCPHQQAGSLRVTRPPRPSTGLPCESLEQPRVTGPDAQSPRRCQFTTVTPDTANRPSGQAESQRLVWNAFKPQEKIFESETCAARSCALVLSGPVCADRVTAHVPTEAGWRSPVSPPPPPVLFSDLGRVQVSGALPAAGPRRVHWPRTPRKRGPPTAPPAASPAGRIQVSGRRRDERPADARGPAWRK